MSLKLSELKKLHDLGLSLIFLRPNDKRPLENGWTSGPRKSWDEIKESFHPSYNVGVRLGESSYIEGQGYLCCIDVDIKDPAYKKDAFAKLKEIVGDGDGFGVVLSGSGNGSRHCYGVSSKPFKMVEIEKHKGKWEICAYSTGRQMVLPPSLHPSGNGYQWLKPLDGTPLSCVDPEKFRKGKALGQDAGDGNENEVFKAVEVDLYSSSLSLSDIKKITEGKGVTDRSAELLSLAMKMCRAKMSDNEILSVLSDRGNWIAEASYEHTQSDSRARAVKWLKTYTLDKARFNLHPMRLFENAPDYSALPKTKPEKVQELKTQIEDETAWQTELQTTKEGAVKLSLFNVEKILSNVQGQSIFVRDEFASRDSYGMDTSWGGKKGSPLTDIDLIKLRAWMSGTKFKLEPGKDIALDAMKLIADRNKHHPVMEWLKSLEWDGTPRLSSWIKTYCNGDAPDPYLSEVSRIFILAMIKRVFEPGCQWDYTLVLEGKQGTYKSTTARILAGDAWFMDNLPDLRDKDVMLNLQGKWVVELGELADVKRGDYNLVKAYLNRRVDTVRSPYDKLKQDIPRQSVFIGTVNEGEYLKDPTGNRRFWPVKVGMCDVEALKRDRDQLFAEAMYVYENFFDGKLMLSEEAAAQASRAQEERRITDDSTEMEEKLFEFMHSKAGQKFPWDKFKLNQLFDHMDCWFDWKGKSYMLQVGSQILYRQGFVRRKIKGQRVWEKGGRGGQTPSLGMGGRGAEVGHQNI